MLQRSQAAEHAAIQDFGRRSETAELLFVNDGSRDETLELLEHLHQTQSAPLQLLAPGQERRQGRGRAAGIPDGLAIPAPTTSAFGMPIWPRRWREIEPFCRVLDSSAGYRSRDRHADEPVGAPHRAQAACGDWLGRLFARTASLALGVRIFDTQCGAKLFRVTPRLSRYFSAAVSDALDFRRRDPGSHAAVVPRAPARRCAKTIYEFPLDAWRDVAGSSLKRADFVKAIGELARIYWTYLGPFRDRTRPELPTAVPCPMPAANRRTATSARLKVC